MMDLILPKKNQIGVLVVYLAIGIIFCIQLYKVENIYTSDYIYVLTSYFLVAGVWIGYNIPLWILYLRSVHYDCNHNNNNIFY